MIHAPVSPVPAAESGPTVHAGPGAAAATDASRWVGIGLRQPHYAQLLSDTPALGFVEVHSENFFAEGGAALAVLHEARAAYPVSLHGVGLALGSAVGLDPWHLDRLERLVQRIEPLRVSDHACFARAPRQAGAAVVHGSDLLPIAFTPASLDIMVRQVTQVQERLRRPIAVENLSAYVAFDAADSMTEPEFFAQLCQLSGCRMLLDVNNLMVNALNAGAADPVAFCQNYLDALPLGVVDEIHLAGFSESGAGPTRLVIDDHSSPVHDGVWAVYAHTLARFGAVQTLVEWDTDLPTLEVLLGEATKASHCLAERLR